LLLAALQAKRVKEDIFHNYLLPFLNECFAFFGIVDFMTYRHLRQTHGDGTVTSTIPAGDAS